MRYGAVSSAPGFGHPAFAHQTPHARAGNDFAGHDHRLDHFQHDAGRRGELPQHVDRAAAIVAEIEISTLDHRPGRQAAADHRLEELLRREGEQLPIRRIGDHRVDAQGGQQLGLAIGPGQRGRGQVGSNSRTGCGSNVNTTAGPPTSRPGNQPLDDPRMAKMHAVKVADGHRPGAERRPVRSDRG